MGMMDDRANRMYFCIPWDVLMYETASLALCVMICQLLGGGGQVSNVWRCRPLSHTKKKTLNNIARACSY